VIGRSDKPIGMLSTHYRQPTRPNAETLRLLDLLARQVADILERASVEAALKDANARLLQADRGARTSFSRFFRTSFATRSRPSATASMCSPERRAPTTRVAPRRSSSDRWST
jgi:GAF domain-containing protein